MSDDDWETDPDFENDVTEEEQRYGAHTIGFARTDVNMQALADSTKSDFEASLKGGPKYDAGYGGDRGDADYQTTEAAKGTRVLTGKEVMQASSGGISGTTAVAMSGGAKSEGESVKVDAAASGAGAAGQSEAEAATSSASEPEPEPAAVPTAAAAAAQEVAAAPAAAAAPAEEAVPPAQAEVATNPVSRQYKVLIKTVVRAGYQMDSAKGGVLAKDEVIDVSEEAPLPNGITRFKYAGGWVSDKASDGRQILELLEDDDEPVE
jgi:hypothetical protein